MSAHPKGDIPCGSESDLQKILMYYRANPSASVDIGAIDASLIYADRQLAPLKEELKSEAASVAYTFLHTLLFIVILLLLLLILWVMYELSMPPTAVLIVLVVFALIAAIIVWLVISFNTIESAIDGSLAIASYNTPANRASLLDVLNESGNAYMSKMGTPCAPQPPG